ncbi:hypothetical protein ACYZT4_11165 [Pseudomonas sp. GB2N2]
MCARQIASLLLATFLSGCSSAPKEKTEFEKQLDAAPMPTTEADRLNQCKNLSDLLFFELQDIAGLNGSSSAIKPHDPSKSLALSRRMDSISCTKAERQNWLQRLQL